MYNLIMVYRPGALDPKNFEDIARRIRQLAPDIDVYIMPSNRPGFLDTGTASDSPTLVFSPMSLQHFKPRRGRVFAGRIIPKPQQMAILQSHGVRVPKWKMLGPDTKLDPAEWGKYVVIKPTAEGAASYGRGVELLPAEAVKFRSPHEFPPDHPGRLAPMIVQQYIYSGRRPTEYRVTALFGSVLGSTKRIVRRKLKFDRSATGTIEGFKTTGHGGAPSSVRYCDEQDILDYGRRTYSAIPDVPLHGVDLIKQYETGYIYVLEVNPGGNTWHFSSVSGRRNPLIEGRRREQQFGAWDIAAKVLIEKTRELAV